MLTVRKVLPCEIDRAMEIFDTARSFMRKNGNMAQWINGYPQRCMIMNDIESGKLYAVCSNSGICGVFYFDVGVDPTYNYIEGEWLNDEEYGVVHRIGSDGTERGVLKCAVDFAFDRVDNVRIDTHADNKVMRHLLSDKMGFTQCGTIYIEDGSPRIAYQKKGL